eukprot:1159222-Pelagomonas_calceolata.AAC.2
MSLQQLLQEGLAGAQAKPSPTQPLLPPSQKEQQEQQAEKQRLQEEKKREQNRRKREQAQRKRLEKRLKQQAKAAGKKRATPPQPQTAATHLSPNSHGNNQKGGAVGPTSGTADTSCGFGSAGGPGQYCKLLRQQRSVMGVESSVYAGCCAWGHAALCLWVCGLLSARAWSVLWETLPVKDPRRDSRHGAHKELRWWRAVLCLWVCGFLSGGA